MVCFAWRCAAAERKGLAARGRLGDRCAALLFALLHLRTSMLGWALTLVLVWGDAGSVCAPSSGNLGGLLCEGWRGGVA